MIEATASTNLVSGFRALFAGREGAHGRYDHIRKDETSAKGKFRGNALTLQEPLTSEVWRRHLTGKAGLGIVPIREDGSVCFGVVDVDNYSLSLSEFAAHIERLAFPLVLCRSKSGGAHLYLFAESAVPASKMIAKLQEIVKKLQLPSETETFPKQDETRTVDIGNWINVPYFDHAQTTRYGIRADGSRLTAEEFLAYAEGRKVGPEFFDIAPKQRAPKSSKKGFELPDEIGEGERETKLTSAAGKLRSQGFGEAEILGALRETNRQRCRPQLPDTDLARIAKSVARYEPRTTEGDKRPNVAKILEELSQDIELFHTPKGEAFGLVPVGEHIECCALKSEVFKGILSYRYFRERNATPGRDSLQSFIDLLCARAAFDGSEKQTYLRFAHVDGRSYLDLANDAWEVVEIDSEGWRLLKQSPVCFRRVAGMKPLPRPEQTGSLAELRRCLNAQDDRHFVLMVSWLVGVFLPRGAFPVLMIQGVHGSAKSGTSGILRSVVDPVAVLLSALPRDERELAITANNSGIVAFDNVSGLSQWLSDAFCRIATGAGYRTRTLHTDSDEQLFETRRPLLANGIDDVATRADLLDRSISVYLKRIPDAARKTDSEVQEGFAARHAQILGALLTAVSTGLRNLSSTKLSSLPRMADFAMWVTACEQALPWEPGTFIRTYLEMRQKAAELSVENDVIAQAVVQIVQNARGRAWEGTADQMLSRLETLVPAERRDLRSWPRTPASLGRWLRRAEPSLSAVGIMLSARRGPGIDRRRLTRIEYQGTGTQASLAEAA